MKPRAVFFDLGNTLVTYYKKEDFGPVLEQCVADAIAFLQSHGLDYEPGQVLDRAHQQNRERDDHRVTPLAHRLNTLFELEVEDSLKLMNGLMEAFMGPVFETARLMPESVETLRKLKQGGTVTGLISNTPWGSPGILWEKHLADLGLREYLDHVVWCVDIGVRKPRKEIFYHALEQAGLEPEDVVFVGDDEEWDLKGARNAGIRGILIGDFSP